MLARYFISVSIHVPRAGYDRFWPRIRRSLKIFLSTYPVRGTTELIRSLCSPISYFYPRTPCGVRRPHICVENPVSSISIHVPRAGYDDCAGRAFGARSISIHVPRAGYDFWKNREQTTYIGISIHVPRAGYDGAWRGRWRLARYFYPRTPCGVRPDFEDYKAAVSVISIHVPRAGYDASLYTWIYQRYAFLSTYPVRGTTRRYSRPRQSRRYFYPRTPCGVRPVIGNSLEVVKHETDYFYPRTPCGVRQQNSKKNSLASTFLSTYPVRGTTAKCDKSNNLFCILA